MNGMKKLLILLSLILVGIGAGAQDLSCTFTQKKTLKALNKVISCVRGTEEAIRAEFLPRFEAWRAAHKKAGDAKFYEEHRAALQIYWARYLDDLQAAGLQ